jgi:hypothetical protein
MNSRLGSVEFAQGRRGDERETSSRAMEPPLHPSELQRLESEHRSTAWRVVVNLARVAVIFCIGVAATLAWQTYGNAARQAVASLSPGLTWLTPAELSTSASSASASPEQLAVISRSLTAVRQSVDKLAADITRLQATKQDPPPARTGPQPATPPAASAGAQGRKSASTTQGR